MTEKPILFNAWSVQRILAGEKTATMRPMKPQPVLRDGWWQAEADAVYKTQNCMGLRVPYQVGDILWLREPWRTGKWHDENTPNNLPDNGPIYYESVHDLYSLYARSLMGRLRPSIHLPKRFARPNRYEVLTLEVRRPQELTVEEIIEEGIRYPHAEVGTPLEAPDGWYRNAWYNLWLKIYGIRSWVGNDWCWRPTFREVK